MNTEHDSWDLAPRPTLPRTTIRVVHRSNISPQTDVFPSPRSEYLNYDGPATPTVLSRNDRAYDQTHRWTVLAREAEADEVSILSVTSEEIGYYASILPEEPVQQPPKPQPSHKRNLTIDTDRNKKETSKNHDPETTYMHTTKEGNTYQLAEVDIGDAIQFSPPLEPAPFLQAPEDELESDKEKYVYYPLPIPRNLMLPPRLTGPHAAKDIPPITTFRPPSFHPPREHATEALESFLDTHETALQEDPEIVMQSEFDSTTLMGTLINNLRDQKTEIRSRARTNADYVPGGKSLLEIDRDAAQRINMGKALSSRGGRKWGSSGASTSPRRTSRTGSRSPYKEEDEIFESVSLAEMPYKEEDEDVPLAMVKDRIVTQRQDAEESLAERMKRLKEAKNKREAMEGETVMQRLERLKLEQKETLAERRARLKMRHSVHKG